MSAPAYTRFREWLIVQLERTRWVHRPESDKETAERLGVQVSVLIEAKKRYAANLERGRLGHGIISEATQLHLKAPQELYAEWLLRCEDMQIEPSALFRTLVHMLLMARENPKCIRGWVVSGKSYTIRADRKKAWPWRIRTHISRGAKSALKIRAERARLTETALVRAQVIEFLEGRIVRIDHIFTSEQMHASAEKYWIGDRT